MHKRIYAWKRKYLLINEIVVLFFRAANLSICITDYTYLFLIPNLPWICRNMLSIQSIIYNV